MDSSFTIKPRDSLARSTVRRSNIVRTDLSPSQSVGAAEQTAADQHAPADPGMRDPALDAQCQALLDREREARRQRRERKDEALLRQQAYTRGSVETPPPPEDSPHADFEV